MESLDQLAGALDLDFLLADPTSGLASSSTLSHNLGTSAADAQQQGELPFDLSLDFGSHDHSSFDIATLHDQSASGAFPAIDIVKDASASSCSPANMSEGGNLLSQSGLAHLEMNRFYSANHPHAISSAAPSTTANIAVSPLSMASLPAQDYRQQPLLAPKQPTPPSSSCSPELNATVPIAVKSGNKLTRQSTTTTTTTRKRSRASAELSSNNSAQDSEDERVVEKRRRNTMAARRFRKRKQDHVEDLESQLASMTKERDDLKLQVAKWEGEVMALRKLLEMKK